MDTVHRRAGNLSHTLFLLAGLYFLIVATPVRATDLWTNGNNDASWHIACRRVIGRRHVSKWRRCAVRR